ncbi:MAG: Flp pilus assembly protein CpaB [Planctomycetaceae bacterium]|nr:Flp pilus assembly protein CpaB [Planctomycetaceae bacterium]
MRVKSILLLVLAMFCGSILAIFVARILNNPHEVQAELRKQATCPVLAVNADVPAGKKVPIENIIVVHVPEENLPEKAVTSFFEVSNSILVKDIPKGAVLLDNYFSNNNHVTTEGFVPPGYQVVTIQISDTENKLNADFKKVKPGDLVDVQLVKKENRSTKNQEHISTILEKICVFETKIEELRVLSLMESPQKNIVSLLVNEEQAKLIYDSQSRGKLRIHLRKKISPAEMPLSIVTEDILPDNSSNTVQDEQNESTSRTTSFLDRYTDEYPMLATPVFPVKEFQFLPPLHSETKEVTSISDLASETESAVPAARYSSRYGETHESGENQTNFSAAAKQESKPFSPAFSVRPSVRGYSSYFDGDIKSQSSWTTILP